MTTVLSLAPAVLAPWATLGWLARREISRCDVVMGGVLFGAGMGAIHSVSMAALQWSPITRQFGGTGLGTTISRQLVDPMGGIISVHSTVGEGRTCRVSLPLPEGRGSTIVASRSEHLQRPPLRVLAVDVVPANIELLQLHLASGGHQVSVACDSQEAVAAFCEGRFEAVPLEPARLVQKMAQVLRLQRTDLILRDSMMPRTDGYAVCRALKTDAATAGIPVVFITALSDSQDEMAGFDAGAVDYITNAVSPPVVRARVRTHLSLVRLERTAKYQDNETGMHVIPMSHFACLLTLAAGCDPDWAEDLLNAAPMHDAGKIGIPDAVLREPAPLDAQEWEIMRQHPLIGAEIIGEHPWCVLQLAREIALAHHEKWDGSGYPYALVGEAIPLSARIVAIAHVFDALTTRRPYKEPWPVQEAMDHITAQSGKHFDPHLTALFPALLAQLQEIRAQWAD